MAFVTSFDPRAPAKPPGSDVGLMKRPRSNVLFDGRSMMRGTGLDASIGIDTAQRAPKRLRTMRPTRPALPTNLGYGSNRTINIVRHATSLAEANVSAGVKEITFLLIINDGIVSDLVFHTHTHNTDAMISTFNYGLRQNSLGPSVPSYVDRVPLRPSAVMNGATLNYALLRLQIDHATKNDVAAVLAKGPDFWLNNISVDGAIFTEHGPNGAETALSDGYNTKATMSNAGIHNESYQARRVTTTDIKGRAELYNIFGQGVAPGASLWYVFRRFHASEIPDDGNFVLSSKGKIANPAGYGTTVDIPALIRSRLHPWMLAPVAWPPGGPLPRKYCHYTIRDEHNTEHHYRDGIAIQLGSVMFQPRHKRVGIALKPNEVHPMINATTGVQGDILTAMLHIRDRPTPF